MSKITKVTRKSMKIRFSGRSSDYISPSFGYGCLLKCSYCYMRRHLKDGVTIADNVGTILTAINNHCMEQVMLDNLDKPNQTDDKYLTLDLSCNEDFSLHHKYHDWRRIFDFFKHHDIAKATLATKIVPLAFLDYNPNGKVRIRFSLMPQMYSDILEPNTAKIIDRINAINLFIEAGYDVHVNFSPVIWHKVSSQTLYKELFELLDTNVKDEYKSIVKAEVIMLTHNVEMHEYNVGNGIDESLIWSPKFQEAKVSEYGGDNLRYKWQVKNRFVREFRKLHDEVIPWNMIRYIF